MYWTGGEKATSTEESPYNIWNAANWGGATPSSSYNLNIATTGTTYLKSEDGNTKIGTDVYLNSGDYVFTGALKFSNLWLGTNANSTVSLTKKNGDWELSCMRIGCGTSGGTAATFVNESGNVTTGLNIEFSGDTGALGTLTIKGGGGGRQI